MGQRIHGNIQRELLTIIGTDAFSFVASIVGAKSAAETVLTHHGDEVPLVEEAFKLNVASFVEATDAIDLVEGTVNKMVVRNRFNFLIGENPAELPPPGIWKIGVSAAT